MTHVTNGDPQNRWKNEIFSKSSNGPIWEVWFSETTHTNSFGTLFRSFGTFFISWGWLRTVVGKEKGKTEFKEYDGQRIASKSKFHHFPFAFLSFSLQRTTHKQESEKLRMGQQKAKKLFELQLHIYNFQSGQQLCNARPRWNETLPTLKFAAGFWVFEKLVSTSRLWFLQWIQVCWINLISPWSKHRIFTIAAIQISPEFHKNSNFGTIRLQ